MRGMWSGDKSNDRGYKPALDALKAIDREILTLALLSVVEHGCALMIGATRDHGAISLILMDGQERHKLYPSTAQELDQAMRDLIESFDTTASSAKPARKTR